MREQRSYSFDTQKSTAFQVYFGNNVASRIVPKRSALGDAYPNPGQGKVTIPFVLSDEAGKQSVLLEVFDAQGHRVSTLANKIFTPGFYSTEWDTEPLGLSGGLYLYRLKVIGKNGAETFTKKVLLNR